MKAFILAGGFGTRISEESRSRPTQRLEPRRVTIIDTGEATMTGGRIKRAAWYIGEETFCLTYGDCVTDLDIGGLIRAHRSFGRCSRRVP